MANFDIAFNMLMAHEGGFVNKPNDLGGPTKWGITQADLASWFNRPVSIDEVQILDLASAKTLYRTRYWEHMKLDAISSTKVAAIVFDQGVLRGTGRIVQDIQHILKLDCDGIMGNDTIESINKMDEKILGLEIIKECQISYARIVELKPTQADFIVGWMIRTHTLLDFLLF